FHILAYGFNAFLNLQILQVAPDCFVCLGVAFDSSYLFRTTADSLYCQCAATGKGIKHLEAGQISEHIKNGSADFLAHRVSTVSSRTVEYPASQTAGYHSHTSVLDFSFINFAS